MPETLSEKFDKNIDFDLDVNNILKDNFPVDHENCFIYVRGCVDPSTYDVITSASVKGDIDVIAATLLGFAKSDIDMSEAFLRVAIGILKNKPEAIKPFLKEIQKYIYAKI